MVLPPNRWSTESWGSWTAKSSQSADAQWVGLKWGFDHQSGVSWNGEISLVLDWDFPWHKPSSYWGTPMATETTRWATKYCGNSTAILDTNIEHQADACWQSIVRSIWDHLGMAPTDQPQLICSTKVKLEFDTGILWFMVDIANNAMQAMGWAEVPMFRAIRIPGWWFGTFFILPYIGNNHPNWLIFFRGVQTTN